MARLNDGRSSFHSKRSRNTPVRGVRSVVKWSDEPRTESSGTEPTDASGGSAVSGRVCEQRYATERVLPESGFELRHAESASEEATLEEEEE